MIDKPNEGLDKLEDNLITVTNDLKVSTEIILKELTSYLNVSAHDLSDIQSSVIKIETILDSIKGNMAKLDNIEKELTLIKPSISQLESNINNGFNEKFISSDRNFKKVVGFLASSMKKIQEQNIDNNNKYIKLDSKFQILIDNFELTKNENIKSQEGLYAIINSLVTNRNDVEKAQISLEDSKIKTDASIKNAKIKFWAKIAGLVLGSGGIITLLITTLLKSLV